MCVDRGSSIEFPRLRPSSPDADIYSRGPEKWEVRWSTSPRYSFMGATRLARDAGVSKSAVSRLMRGETTPSFTVAVRSASALERSTGLAIDPREIVSESGEWGVPFVCDLMGCKGCLASWMYDGEERVRPEFAHVLPAAGPGNPIISNS